MKKTYKDVDSSLLNAIPNPDKKERNKPFIRVNAKEVWGNPNKVYMMKN